MSTLTQEGTEISNFDTL